MSIFHVLYQSYMMAEEKGLVDRPELDMSKRNITILPIYHTNRRSDGKNSVQIILDAEGLPDRLNFLEKDVYTNFPVTESSLNRTRNIFAHPLCDDMQYLSKSLDKKKYEHYCEQNEQWLDGILSELSGCSDRRDEKAEDIKKFLQQVREIVVGRDILQLVKELIAREHRVLVEGGATIEIEIGSETKGSKAATKEIDLSKIFITFGKQFTDRPDIDITNSKLLHEAHIRYIKKMQAGQADAIDICDVSGKRMYCTNFHRGFFPRSKIIVKDAHVETHVGRFQNSSEVIRLGADTSEKIHLMLKFFLEHRENAQGLYNNTTAIVWFSDDILNEREFSLSDPVRDSFDEWDNPPEESGKTSISDSEAAAWKKILRGDAPLPKKYEASFFYFMTINRVSDGRIAIQSTRTMPITMLLENLRHWNQTCSWEIWSRRIRERENRTPRPGDIVRFVYGIEGGDGKVDCLNDKLKSSAFKRILPSIIDGMSLPKDMGRQIFSNYKNRIGYGENWMYLQYMSCALLNKVRQDERKEKRLPMLEKDKQTRDYLYGRLLAVYEKVELDAMKPVSISGGKQGDEENKNKSKSSRLTNVEKVWSAFFQSPERMLGTLHMKIRPYLDKLKSNQAGSYNYYNSLIGEIQTDIRDAESYLANKNKALNEDAVFGYYAQNREFYRPRDEKKENENA